MWQDWVFSIGQWGFTLALLPSLLGKSIMPKFTCAMTATILTSFVVCFATLDFNVSAWSTLATTLSWWALLIKAIIKERR